MYLTALMQVTRLGCEIPRSKERLTNPFMNILHHGTVCIALYRIQFV